MSEGIVVSSGRFVPALPRDRAAGHRNLAATLGGVLVRAWRRRRDRSLLATFDDRALSDIGIGPGGIDHAVRFGRGADVGTRRGMEF